MKTQKQITERLQAYENELIQAEQEKRHLYAVTIEAKIDALKWVLLNRQSPIL
jgi:hypothetical protein